MREGDVVQVGSPNFSTLVLEILVLSLIACLNGYTLDDVVCPGYAL
jgi:hypothetical protein